VVDQVFLRASPAKGIARFSVARKLSIGDIGSYPVIQRVGEVEYRLELQLELPSVHNVFHVSEPQKYILDPSHVSELDIIQLQEDLLYAE